MLLPLYCLFKCVIIVVVLSDLPLHVSLSLSVPCRVVSCFVLLSPCWSGCLYVCVCVYLFIYMYYNASVVVVVVFVVCLLGCGCSLAL